MTPAGIRSTYVDTGFANFQATVHGAPITASQEKLIVNMLTV